MQTDEGIWYPMGGTRAIPEALARLATELGVAIHSGTDVLRILTKDNQVTGVVTAGGDEITCDAIVSNCDAVRTYRELLDDTPQSSAVREKKSSPTGLQRCGPLPWTEAAI